MTFADEVVFHDLENGSDDDLEFWRSLDLEGRRVLELGAGTGRVALALAEQGANVVALDTDEEFLGVLRSRALDRGPAAPLTYPADARSFDVPGQQFNTIIASNNFIQLFTERKDRLDILGCACRHLEPGGEFYVSFMEDMSEMIYRWQRPSAERKGWRYAAQPVRGWRENSVVFTKRRRRVGLKFSQSVIAYAVLDAGQLRAEADAAGFSEGAEVAQVPATDEYVGSTILRFRRPAR